MPPTCRGHLLHLALPAAMLALPAPALAHAQVSGDFDLGTAARRAPPGVAVETARDRQPFTPTDYKAVDPTRPTLHIAGDSTASTGDPAHRGWGAVLADFFDPSKINIVNRAVGGRSFRTFTAEGKWDALVGHLKPGDWVIIEFGHNDGGNPALPRSRGDVPGIGDDVVGVSAPDGTTETVHSYGWYLRKYIRDAKAKGARPIVSTTTPRNYWDGPTRTKIERGLGQMLDWAKQVAGQEHVPVVDHSNVTADALEKVGFEDSQRFFPSDHTHTGTEGALLNARTLIAGLKGLPGKPLAQYLNREGRRISDARPDAGWTSFSPPGKVDGNRVRGDVTRP